MDPSAGLSKQLTRFPILITIGEALAAKLELDPLLETVYREASRLFDTTHFCIALHRKGSQRGFFVLEYVRGERQPVGQKHFERGLNGYILRTGKRLFLPTLAEKERFLSEERIDLPLEPALSWMGVPLAAGEHVMGVMSIQSHDAENLYTKADLDLLSAIASQLAVAVRNAQLYEDVQRRTREMEAIATIGRDLTSTLDLGTVLGRVVSSVRSMLANDTVAIFLEDPDGGSFKTVVASGTFAEALRAFRVVRGKGILGSIVQNEQSDIVNDVAADPRTVYIPGTPPTLAGEKLIATPLHAMQKVIGLLAVWRNPVEPLFDRSDAAFLEGIGRQASVAIRNAQLYGQAKSALSEAENANCAKSTFLANMSHELRTPLNAILLYSELMMEEIRERDLGEQLVDLEKIQGAGKHLLALIDDILDLSKIEAGRMTVYIEPCDVASMVADISATVGSLIAKNGNRLLLDVDPVLTTIPTDHRKLRQTLINLLSNASKFTYGGIVQLKVVQEAEHISFHVTDTGIGMTPEQVECIFQEFYQAEDSTFRRFGGTGLGLTLCRKFMDLLGGEIRVDSKSGYGSTFTVRIPIVPPPSG